MANEQIKQNFKNIANAIRSKTGENGTMTAEEMPSKIEAIETGIIPSGSLDITANGNNIDVTTKATVNVNVPNPSSGTLNITENGVYDVTEKASVDVQVEGSEELVSESVYLTDNEGKIISGSQASVDQSNGTVCLVYENDIETCDDLQDGKFYHYAGSGTDRFWELNVYTGGYYYLGGDSGWFEELDGLESEGMYYFDGSKTFESQQCQYGYLYGYVDGSLVQSNISMDDIPSGTAFFKWSIGSNNPELTPIALGVGESMNLGEDGSPYGYYTITRIS